MTKMAILQPEASNTTTLEATYEENSNSMFKIVFRQIQHHLSGQAFERCEKFMVYIIVCGRDWDFRITINICERKVKATYVTECNDLHKKIVAFR